MNVVNYSGDKRVQLPSYITKDSGERESHETGAVRDVRTGKGRYDLISPYAIGRLAQLLERGAEKYDARNWEKGFKFSRCIDSAMRHLFQYIEGQNDEDHLAAVLFNIMAVMHFQATHQELDDMPHYNTGTAYVIEGKGFPAEPIDGCKVVEKVFACSAIAKPEPEPHLRSLSEQFEEGIIKLGEILDKPETRAKNMDLPPLIPEHKSEPSESCVLATKMIHADLEKELDELRKRLTFDDYGTEERS